MEYVTILTKTRLSGPPLKAFYPTFPENACLCPVHILKEYVARTASLGSESVGQNPLFIAIKKPLKETPKSSQASHN